MARNVLVTPALALALAIVVAAACATTPSSSSSSSSSSPPLVARWRASLREEACAYEIEIVSLDGVHGVAEINHVSDDSAEKACSFARLALVLEGDDVMRIGENVATCRYRLEDADHLRVSCEDHGKPPPPSSMTSGDPKDSLVLARSTAVVRHGAQAFVGTWDAPAFWGAGTVTVGADGSMKHGDGVDVGRVVVESDDSVRLTLAGRTERCDYRALDDKLTITCTDEHASMPLVFTRRLP